MEPADFLTSSPAHAPAPPPAPERMQREHDSMDDFEHLDHELKPAREDLLADVEPIIHAENDVREADLLSLGAEPPAPPVREESRNLQAFLDTEREEMVVAPPRIVPEDRFSDSREELSPAPSDDSLPDAIDNFASPPSPARQPAAAPPTPPAHRDPTPPPPPKHFVEEKPAPPKPVEQPVDPPTPTPTPAPSSTPSQRAVTDAEAIFCQMGLDAWFSPGRLHPKVESLVYWRSPVKSGIALGAGLIFLIALACCSLISVFAYTSILALTATTAFRIYSSVLQAVQKTSDGHPFKELLETDLSIKPERAQELAVLATAHVNGAVSELRRLFLVEDLVDSLKFGVSLWCLTYVGAWFNGMTLLIIGYVALFTLPKVYETNKTQIDANLDLVSAKLLEITNKVKAAIPIGKKGESEKDK